MIVTNQPIGNFPIGVMMEFNYENLDDDECKVEFWVEKQHLHCDKTKTMLVAGKRLKKKLNPNLRSLQISLNDNQVEQVTIVIWQSYRYAMQ